MQASPFWRRRGHSELPSPLAPLWLCEHNTASLRLTRPRDAFSRALDKDVVVNGKVVLPVGTKVSGQVATSKRTHTSSQRLSVNITDVQVGGRSLPIKTAGAIGPEQSTHKTRRGVSVSTYSYQVPSGRRIEFRLAQPLNL